MPHATITITRSCGMSEPNGGHVKVRVYILLLLASLSSCGKSDGGVRDGDKTKSAEVDAMALPSRTPVPVGRPIPESELGRQAIAKVAARLDAFECGLIYHAVPARW